MNCSHNASLSILTGVDLENIVYYRDNTHYFVMTAKKQSLLDKGVVINVSKIYICVIFHAASVYYHFIYNNKQIDMDIITFVCRICTK